MGQNGLHPGLDADAAQMRFASSDAPALNLPTLPLEPSGLAAAAFSHTLEDKSGGRVAAELTSLSSPLSKSSAPAQRKRPRQRISSTEMSPRRRGLIPSGSAAAYGSGASQRLLPMSVVPVTGANMERLGWAQDESLLPGPSMTTELPLQARRPTAPQRGTSKLQHSGEPNPSSLSPRVRKFAAVAGDSRAHETAVALQSMHDGEVARNGVVTMASASQWENEREISIRRYVHYIAHGFLESDLPDLPQVRR